jgi:hypothetical protein
MKPMHRNRASVLLLLAGALVLAGCASVKAHMPAMPHWPFGKSVAAPEPVHELEVAVPPEQTMPVVLQFWERNTLVIDLQEVASAGQISLSRTEGNRWPARVAFRMSPTRFEVLDVRGAQRVVLPVSSTGPTAVTVELPPSTYSESTVTLTVRWGAKGQ